MEVCIFGYENILVSLIGGRTKSSALLCLKRKEVNNFVNPSKELVSSEVVLEHRPDDILLEVAGYGDLLPYPLLLFPPLLPGQSQDS